MMKSFNFNIYFCFCLVRSEIIFSFPWNFKFSSLKCGIILVRKHKLLSFFSLTIKYLASISFALRKYRIRFKTIANSFKTFPPFNKWALEKNPRLLDCLISYNSSTNCKLVIHNICTYILNDFNSNIHDTFDSLLQKLEYRYFQYESCSRMKQLEKCQAHIKY